MAANPEQNLEQWMTEFDELSESPDSNKTELLKNAEAILAKHDPEKKNVQILVRVAKATFKAAGDAEIAKDKALHQKLLEQTVKLTDAVFDIDVENGEAHAWAAYACGKLADYAGVKERIQKGKQVQMHLEKAIAADPDKYSLHFTFGRWCMEVAKLSWMERKVASTLFEKVPEATYEDAIKHFESCETLKPDWRAVRYWKAKSQIALKKYAEAIKSLDAAAQLPAVEAEDTVIESDMNALITKYASYR